LYRADAKTRADYYKTMLDTGVMSRDEIRQKENLNPIGAEAGGTLHTVQVNQIALEHMAAFSEKMSKPNENGANNTIG
jgi:hypothetical protein